MLQELAGLSGVVRTSVQTLPKILGFLDEWKNRRSRAEIDKIKKFLRIIYFRPDYILAEMREILADGGSDRRHFDDLLKKLDDSEASAEEARRYLNSDKVITNMSVENKVVNEIRIAADQKGGIRAHLRAFALAGKSTGLSPADLHKLSDVQVSIGEMNDLIDKILEMLSAPEPVAQKSSLIRARKVKSVRRTRRSATQGKTKP
jgi:hypothetical protein